MAGNRELFAMTGLVVDDDDRVDVVAAGRFEFGDVIVETAVAGETHDRTVRQRAFHAHRQQAGSRHPRSRSRRDEARRARGQSGSAHDDAARFEL